jgi:hypothetical protein
VHHPLNAYRLLRHVAVGWGVVEAGLAADLQRRGGDGGTRLNRVLRRRQTRHVPDEPDVDGVAKGIVRQECLRFLIKGQFHKNLTCNIKRVPTSRLCADSS